MRMRQSIGSVTGTLFFRYGMQAPGTGHDLFGG